jgi:carbon storage regulator CsrA
VLILERKEGESIIATVNQDEAVRMLKAINDKSARATIFFQIGEVTTLLQKEQKIKINITEIHQYKIKLGFEAPPNVKIMREELLNQQKKEKENESSH